MVVYVDIVKTKFGSLNQPPHCWVELMFALHKMALWTHILVENVHSPLFQSRWMHCPCPQHLHISSYYFIHFHVNCNIYKFKIRIMGRELMTIDQELIKCKVIWMQIIELYTSHTVMYIWFRRHLLSLENSAGWWQCVSTQFTVRPQPTQAHDTIITVATTTNIIIIIIIIMNGVINSRNSGDERRSIPTIGTFISTTKWALCMLFEYLRCISISRSLSL